MDVSVRSNYNSTKEEGATTGFLKKDGMAEELMTHDVSVQEEFPQPQFGFIEDKGHCPSSQCCLQPHLHQAPIPQRLLQWTFTDDQQPSNLHPQ